MVPSGSTPRQILASIGIIPGPLDRVEPDLGTPINFDSSIRFIRVQENYTSIQVDLPYPNQIIRNETILLGESRIIQAGVNGSQEITYRHLIEDGKEILNQPYKTTIIKEPIPEIIMVGEQAPFEQIPIPGRIVYLQNGDAWVMEKNASNRYPIITSGDLDGRILRLSPTADWLLFSRNEEGSDERINSLWALNLLEPSAKPINLGVSNVVAYAEWIPGLPSTVAYSTAESRQAPPGWQANNDLITITIKPDNSLGQPKVIIPSNSGGIYGWWGASFTWSPDGKLLAYSRPDGIGLIDQTKGSFNPLLSMIPYRARGDWAWRPNISWAADANLIYTVTHSPSKNTSDPEESPVFDTVSVSLSTGATLPVRQNTGMFANPVPLVLIENESQKIAYLQAAFPDQSEASQYTLWVVDPDGSNPRSLFPKPGAPGLQPQRIHWSPQPILDNQPGLLVLYEGNLWLIPSNGGNARQLTADGQTDLVDWK